MLSTNQSDCTREIMYKLHFITNYNIRLKDMRDKPGERNGSKKMFNVNAKCYINFLLLLSPSRIKYVSINYLHIGDFTKIFR